MNRRFLQRHCALALALLFASGSAMAAGREAQKVDVAREVFLELFRTPDQEVPEWMIADAKCVAVIPSVIKGAFVWGGRRGRGIMTCRSADGVWGPIAFVKLSGASFGLQIGGESTDLVLFFLTERGARSLLRSKFVIGADASIAAGPIGRTAEASTDLRARAEILSYAKSRGAFAGLSLEGAQLAPDLKWMERYYGERVWPDEVLFDHKVPTTPGGSQAFLDILP